MGTPKAPVQNRYGLTWQQWCRAAGIPPGASLGTNFRTLRLDWRNGVDPTEWREWVAATVGEELNRHFHQVVEEGPSAVAGAPEYVPPEVLARRARYGAGPRRVSVPVDLDDHLFPDAPREDGGGIVSRPWEGR